MTWNPTPFSNLTSLVAELGPAGGEGTYAFFTG